MGGIIIAAVVLIAYTPIAVALRLAGYMCRSYGITESISKSGMQSDYFFFLFNLYILDKKKQFKLFIWRIYRKRDNCYNNRIEKLLER